MGSIQQTIRALGGIAARRELLARGHIDGWIRIAYESGSIERVRNGWYSLPGADDAVRRAWRVGGRLACVSAARYHYGLELPSSGEIHVSVHSQSVRLRQPGDRHQRLRETIHDDVVVHWADARAMDELRSYQRRAVSLAGAVDQIMRCPRAVEAAATLMRNATLMPGGNGNR